MLEIKERILKLKREGKASSLTEIETRQLLIDPLITAMGYNFNELDQVRLGWRGGKEVQEQKEADYALFLPGQTKPSIIVEAKRLRSELKDEKILSQTLMYAFINGVAWCIVTNGNTITVFDAFDKNRKDRSLFPAFDIEQLDADQGISSERAEFLLGLLTPDALRNGKPDDYRDGEQARKAVYETVLNCVRGPEKSFVRLIKKTLNRKYNDRQISAALRYLSVTAGDEAPTANAEKSSIRQTPQASIKPIMKPKKGPRRAERIAVWEKKNTLVCPMRDDGFNETFLGENRWYAIRLRKDRIPYIKYIAAYRVRPISAITHYAEVASIVPCGKEEIARGAASGFDCKGKYIVQLKGKPIAIKPTHVLPGVPQGIVFVSLDEILGG